MTTAEKLQHVGDKPMQALTILDIQTCSYDEMQHLISRSFNDPDEGAALFDRLDALGVEDIFDRFPPKQSRELSGSWDGLVLHVARHESALA